jgi:paraquat-inducible protein A
MDRDTLIACHECDALLQKPLICGHEIARCPRCGGLLYRGGTHRLDRMCALTLASLITFLIAQGFPILEMDVNGNLARTTLFGALHALWNQGMPLIALMVFISTFLFPLIELSALLYVLFPLRAGNVPPGCKAVLRAIHWVRPWGMIEVFMLGILVTIVKMTSLAHVVPEAALFAFAALTLMIASVVSFDPHVLWDLADPAPNAAAPAP